MKLTKLTVGLHIAISQNRCTRFYSGKPVFSANSVSFTPLYFVTSLSWQFLNRTKGNWRSKTILHQFIIMPIFVVLTARSRRNGKKVSKEKKIYSIIRIYNNYINNKLKQNAIMTKIEKKKRKKPRTQNILFFAREANNEGAIDSV